MNDLKTKTVRTTRRVACTALGLALAWPTLGLAQTGSASGPLVVRIGHAGPLRGPLAHLGLDTERGARLAIDELNTEGRTLGGRKLRFELVSEDEGSDAKSAAAAADRLLAAKVVGVVGHLKSATALAAAPRYEAAGVPAIAVSVSHPQLTAEGRKTSFRLLPSDVQAARLLGRHATDVMGARRVAVLDDGSAYGVAVADAFAAQAESFRSKVLLRRKVAPKTISYIPLIEAMKAENINFMFFGGLDTQAGPMLRKMREEGMSGVFTGLDSLCTTRLPELSAQMTEQEMACAEVGGVDPEKATPFDERFRKQYRSAPVVYAPFAYDAVKLLAQAVQGAGSTAPEQVLPALAKTQGWAGVTVNSLSFDATGNAQGAGITVFNYSNGQRVKNAVVR